MDATTFPRSKLGAVPYALEAGRATSAAGALEARIAAVEARTGGRQIVIADVDAGSVSADASCEVGYTISSASAPFTFVASTTGIYRISTNIRYSGTAIVFRIGSVPSMPFYSRTATRTLESGLTSGTSAFYSGPITALVQLDAGHSYTFRLEERGSSVAIPGCNSPGGLQLISPLIAEQLN